jgi:hypothetical protein
MAEIFGAGRVTCSLLHCAPQIRRGRAPCSNPSVRYGKPVNCPRYGTAWKAKRNGKRWRRARQFGRLTPRRPNAIPSDTQMLVPWTAACLWTEHQAPPQYQSCVHWPCSQNKNNHLIFQHRLTPLSHYDTNTRQSSQNCQPSRYPDVPTRIFQPSIHFLRVEAQEGCRQ